MILFLKRDSTNFTFGCARTSSGEIFLMAPSMCKKIPSMRSFTASPFSMRPTLSWSVVSTVRLMCSKSFGLTWLDLPPFKMNIPLTLVENLKISRRLRYSLVWGTGCTLLPVFLRKRSRPIPQIYRVGVILKHIPPFYGWLIIKNLPHFIQIKYQSINCYCPSGRFYHSST